MPLRSRPKPRGRPSDPALLEIFLAQTKGVSRRDPGPQRNRVRALTRTTLGASYLAPSELFKRFGRRPGNSFALPADAQEALRETPENEWHRIPFFADPSRNELLELAGSRDAFHPPIHFGASPDWRFILIACSSGVEVVREPGRPQPSDGGTETAIPGRGWRAAPLLVRSCSDRLFQSLKLAERGLFQGIRARRDTRVCFVGP